MTMFELALYKGIHDTTVRKCSQSLGRGSHVTRLFQSCWLLSVSAELIRAHGVKQIGLLTSK